MSRALAPHPTTSSRPPILRQISAAALTAVLAAGSASAQTVLLDDFDDGDAAGWTDYDPLRPWGFGGSYSFPNGSYQITAQPVTTTGLGLGRAGAYREDLMEGDFYASVDVLSTAGDRVECGIAARLVQIGVGSTDGVYLAMGDDLDGDGSVLIVTELVAEVPYNMGTMSFPTPTGPTRLVFEGDGPNVKGEVIDLGTREVLAQVQGQPLFARGGGHAGVLVVAPENEATSAEFDNFVFAPRTPWIDLGQGLARTGGVTPSLEGRGLCATGGSVRLTLTDAMPAQPTFLIIGTDLLQAPFSGGTLVPRLDGLVVLSSDASGGFEFYFQPSQVPSGVDLVLQTWTMDPGAVRGLSASNGLMTTSL